MNIGTLAVSIVARTQKFEKGIRRSRVLAKGFAGAVTKMAAAAAAAAAVVVSLANSHNTLNRSMNASLAIMSNVSAELQGAMLEAALAVSRTTRFSASQAAEAYFFLASAGLDAQQSLAAMPQVAAFATAGNFDLALATDLATDTQSALGLASKDAAENLKNLTRVTDVLVKGNTLANTSAQQLSEAFTNKAAAALRLVNKDMKEGAAVLLAYADQGIKGAEAGTALGIVMRDLQTKALKNAAAFKRAGIEVFDQTGKMQPLAEIIGDIEQKLGGMSDAQKKATLLAVGFSDKSVAYIQTLLGTSEKIKGYEEALRNAGDATQEVAGKQLTNMDKATARLGAAWEALAANMGPVVGVLAEYVVGAARQLEVMGKQQGMIVGFADFLSDLRIIWLGVSIAIKSVGAAMAVFGRITLAVFEGLTGLETGLGSFLDATAQGLEAAIKDTSKQLDEALVAEKPSEKMAKLVAKMKREADKQDPIKLPIEPAGETLLARADSLLGSVGSRVADVIGRAATEMKSAEESIKKTLLNDALFSASFGLLGEKANRARGRAANKARVELPPLAARSADSLDGQAALRRNLRGTRADREVPEKIDKTNELLGEAVETLDSFKFFGLQPFPINGGGAS